MFIIIFLYFFQLCEFLSIIAEINFAIEQNNSDQVWHLASSTGLQIEDLHQNNMKKYMAEMQIERHSESKFIISFGKSAICLTFRASKKMTKEKTSIKGFPNKIFVSFWTFSIYRVDFQWDSRKLNNPTLSYAFFKVKTSPNSFTHNILMNCWTLFISDLIHLQFGLIEGL